jgi:hypothetical protein
MEEIIEKIQKLLEFQAGAEKINSPEEAANAAEKVQKLLMKYNLQMEDIGQRKQKSKVGKNEFKDITPKKNESTWIFDLYNGLAKYNMCKLIIMSRWSPDKSKVVQYACLIGEEQNILTVKFLGDQLEPRLRNMGNKRFHEFKNAVGEKKNTFMRGYLKGAARGIHNQLKDAQEKMMREESSCNALVLVKSKAIEEFVAEEFKNLGKAKSTHIKGSGGFGIGQLDGQSMSINQGIAGGQPQGAIR